MPIDKKTGRPILGPADEATRKRMIDEALATDKVESRKFGEKQAEKEEAQRQATRKKKKSSTTLGDLLDPSKPRERTVRGENTSLSEAVQEGVRQGTEADKKRK